MSDARPESSPLHPAFEWDDTAAAERYRESQAGYIMRHLLAAEQPVDATRVAVPTRAYVSIGVSDSAEAIPISAQLAPFKPRAYLPVAEAMLIPAVRNQLVRDALAALVACRERYRELRELARVFDAIDQLEVELSPAA